MKAFQMCLCVLLMVGMMIGTACADEMLGRYEGYRASKASAELVKLEAQHFALVHAGKTAEAAALLRDRIKPLREKISEFKCWLETRTYTSTEPGVFEVYMYFARLSENEGSNGGVDVSYVLFKPTLEQFDKIFLSKAAVTKLSIPGYTYNTWVSAETRGSVREVVVYQENTVDDEETRLIKRQTCKITIEQGLITTMQVRKERRRLFGMGGWSKTFSADAVGMRCVARGLRLIGLGDMGFLQDRTRIKKALAAKDDKTFSALIKEERK